MKFACCPLPLSQCEFPYLYISLQWTGEGEEAETDFVRQIWGGASSQFRREKKTGLGKKLGSAMLCFLSFHGNGRGRGNIKVRLFFSSRVRDFLEKKRSLLNLMITRFVYFPIVAAVAFSQIGNRGEKSQKKSRPFVREAKPDREEKIFHY